MPECVGGHYDNGSADDVGDCFGHYDYDHRDDHV